jgi:hypothetical protein
MILVKWSRLRAQIQTPSPTKSTDAAPTESLQVTGTEKQADDISELLDKICGFGAAIPTLSRFGSLEEAAQNPLVGIKAYK